ncbi:MAG: hypothetical protein WCI97_08130 [Bacteroidota bacterium]
MKKYLSIFILLFLFVQAFESFGQVQFCGLKTGLGKYPFLGKDEKYSQLIGGITYDYLTKEKISFGAEVLFDRGHFFSGGSENYKHILPVIRIGYRSTTRFFVLGNIGASPSFMINSKHINYYNKNDLLGVWLFTEAGIGCRFSPRASVTTVFRKEYGSESNPFYIDNLNRLSLNLGFQYNINYNRHPDSISINKFHAVVFILPGINFTIYDSTKFANYVYDKTVNSEYNSSIKSNSQYQSYGYQLRFSDFERASFTPSLSVGLKINSAKNKQNSRIIEASYLQFSNKYSYSVSYSKQTFYFFSDTTDADVLQKIISLHYKMEPTFKFIFFSVGVSTSINFIRIEKQLREKEIITDEYSPKIVTKYFSSSVIDKLHFVNFPLHLGVGGNINLKKIILRPAFYFTPCLTKGYYFYNFSIEIFHNYNKN